MGVRPGFSLSNSLDRGLKRSRLEQRSRTCRFLDQRPRHQHRLSPVLFFVRPGQHRSEPSRGFSQVGCDRSQCFPKRLFPLPRGQACPFAPCSESAISARHPLSHSAVAGSSGDLQRVVTGRRYERGDRHKGAHKKGLSGPRHWHSPSASPVWTIFCDHPSRSRRTSDSARAQFGLIGTPIFTSSIIHLALGVWTDQYGGRRVYTVVMLAAAVATWLLPTLTYPHVPGRRARRRHRRRLVRGRHRLRVAVV